MTKEKWMKIYQEEKNKLAASYVRLPNHPREWALYKSQIMTLIDEMDRATEVFFMEQQKEKI